MFNWSLIKNDSFAGDLNHPLVEELHMKRTRILLADDHLMLLDALVNLLNQENPKVGGAANFSYRFKWGDFVSLHFESSYLPGSGNRLVNNTFGNLNYSKIFR